MRRMETGIASGRETAVCFCASFMGMFAHAGFLRGLLEAGVRPDRVAGSSAGGLVAGLYGSGVEPDQIVERFNRCQMWKLWIGWKIPLRFLGVVLHRPGSGVFSSDQVIRQMEELFESARLEEARVPTEITSFNASDERVTIHRSGPLAQVCAATCAVPGLVQPIRIGESWHVDAGLLDGSPCGHWELENHIGTIVIHRIVTHTERRTRQLSPQVGLFDLLASSHIVQFEQALAAKVDRLRNAGKRVHLVETSAPRPSTFTTGGRREALECGHEEGLRAGELILDGANVGSKAA